MERGRSRWMTNRMSGLSIPIPEGDRRHHHLQRAGLEVVLDPAAHLRLEAGVVRLGPDAVVGEERGGLLHRTAREGVDDSALAAARADHAQERVAGAEPLP